MFYCYKCMVVKFPKNSCLAAKAKFRQIKREQKHSQETYFIRLDSVELKGEI